MASSSTQATWCSTATSRTIRGTATASGLAARAEFICIARIWASRESSLTTPDPVRAEEFTLVAFVSDGGTSSDDSAVGRGGLEPPTAAITDLDRKSVV